MILHFMSVPLSFKHILFASNSFRLPPWHKASIIVYILVSSFLFWTLPPCFLNFSSIFLMTQVTFNKISLLLDLVSVFLPMIELFLVETWPHASYIHDDIWCIELVSIYCVSSYFVIRTSSMTLSELLLHHYSLDFRWNTIFFHTYSATCVAYVFAKRLL
jgi:hypothetical protein